MALYPLPAENTKNTKSQQLERTTVHLQEKLSVFHVIRQWHEKLTGAQQILDTRGGLGWVLERAHSKSQLLSYHIQSSSAYRLCRIRFHHRNICGSAVSLLINSSGTKEGAKISSYLNFDIPTIDYLHNAHHIVEHQTEFLTVI